jgi:hypothetical protein
MYQHSEIVRSPRCIRVRDVVIVLLLIRNLRCGVVDVVGSRAGGKLADGGSDLSYFLYHLDSQRYYIALICLCFESGYHYIHVRWTFPFYSDHKPPLTYSIWVGDADRCRRRRPLLEFLLQYERQ